MPTIEIIIFSVIFFAMFIEGIIGFGSALISVPLLIQLVGIKTAPPTFALMALVNNIVMLVHYRAHWNFQSIWRILAASLPAIPLGIVLARVVPEKLAMVLLGGIVIAYALYALFSPRIPQVSERWGFLAGFTSGITHGAYTIAGPPLVIFGNARRWEPQEFKGNLQTIFFINGILIVAAHFVNGSITPDVLHYCAIMVVGGFLGLLLGFWMDKYIRPEFFRRAVLILLIFVGLSLIFK
jgi:uncharacterized membrane protein YfcA